jgi:NAD(P)-dependent dehydrogenase (short-subunit alcohol dehydrogenase family)
MDDPLLADRVVLVTGAASGIGRAIALQFAESGYHVCALDRDAASLLAFVDQMSGHGEAEVLAIEADIADAAAMQRAAETIEQRFGRLDVVVANAGGNGYLGRLEEIEPWMWDEVIAQNLPGLYLTARCTMPLLKRSVAEGHSSLLVIASINGSRVFHLTGTTAYTCCKAAQVAFVKTLAVEVAAEGVRVNAICPGWVATNSGQATRFVGALRFQGSTIPLTGNRPASASQVADLALFLASEAAAHITGAEIAIDGGESLARARS